MKDKVKIFDTTLRDGEQCPGATMTLPEKLRVAKQLAKLNVDVIEAGFPISSDEDFESVKTISGEIQGPEIAGLCRCVEKDINRGWEALKEAENPRLHIFLATSPQHREFKFKKAQDEILKMAVKMTQYAASLCTNVEFSTEDAARTELSYLAEVVEAVIAAGATTVNVPDTVGYAIPWQYGATIAYLFKNVKNINDAIISTHCHNDLGLAVANSLSAVANGARQVEVAINGLGERAGNCSLEEVVMAIKTRSDIINVETSINTKEIMPASKLIRQITGFAVAPNKAIVGDNAFRHEAGIHQHGMLANRSTYEIMSPADVGIHSEDIGSGLVLGKHSGHHAFKKRLEELGYELNETEVERALKQFKDIADKKKKVYDEDIRAIIDEVTNICAKPTFTIDTLSYTSGNRITPEATVKLKKGEKLIDEKTSTGDGPVDAIFKAMNQITEMNCELEGYSIRSVTGGREALGEVTVKVKYNDKIYSGVGASTDVIEASAKAYLNCINRIL